jgi:hypothetical protein
MSGFSGGSSITPGNGLTSTLTASAPGTAFAGAGTLSAAHLVNAQSGTSYAIVDGDRAKLVTATNAAAQAYTIAQAGAASAFQAGWYVDIQNNSTNVAGVVTVTPATSTINYGGISGASIKIYQGQTVRLISDGTNYEAVYLQAAGPWLAYTAAPSSSVGTITTFGTVVARFAMIGPKTVNVQADVPITTAGSGAGFLKVPLPFTASSNMNYQLGQSREVATTGKSGVCVVPSGSSFMEAIDYSATSFIASGAEVNFAAVYDVP